MNPQIIHLLLTYRYLILVPLTFLEGPIIAFIAGTLASLGYFNIFLLGIIFFVRDISVDGLSYALGYFGQRTKIVHRLMAKIGVSEEHMEGVRNLWEHNAGKTMFFSKLSYGLSATFLVIAGFLGVSLRKFFFYGIVTTIFQYGLLLLLGYYFGNAFGSISIVLNNLQYVIAGITIFISGYYIVTHIIRRRLLHREEEAEREAEKKTSVL